MKQYYVHDGQKPLGPFTLQQLMEKRVKKDAYLWYEGMTNWTRAGDLPELQEYFISRDNPNPYGPQQPPAQDNNFQTENFFRNQNQPQMQQPMSRPGYQQTAPPQQPEKTGGSKNVLIVVLVSVIVVGVITAAVIWTNARSQRRKNAWKEAMDLMAEEISKVDSTSSYSSSSSSSTASDEMYYPSNYIGVSASVVSKGKKSVKVSATFESSAQVTTYRNASVVMTFYKNGDFADISLEEIDFGSLGPGEVFLFEKTYTDISPSDSVDITISTAETY